MDGNRADRAGHRGISLRGIIFARFIVLGGLEGNHPGENQVRVLDLTLEINGDLAGQDQVATPSLERAAEMTAVVITGIVGIHGRKREYGSEDHLRMMR